MEAADRELVAAGVEGANVGAGNDSISLKRHSVTNSNGGGKGGAGASVDRMGRTAIAVAAWVALKEADV